MRPVSAKYDRILTRVFALLVFVPMLCVFPYLAAVNNPNENVRTYMTIALVEDHTFCIDKVVERFGWVNDMARVPRADGTVHYYSVKAPATSYAGVPVYWAFAKIAPHFGHPVPTLLTPPHERVWWLRMSTWVLRIFVVQLPCFLFLLFFERYLRAFSPDPALRFAAVAAAGLGTNYLAYTHMFASHALFAVAAFAGFAVTEREMRRSHGDAKRRRWTIAFLAGWFVGWSVLLEYHALPVALVLSMFAAVVFRRPTRFLAFSAGGLFHVAAMMFFQWRAYGNPLTPGHKMVENPKFAAEHHQGVFGILMPKWENVANLSAHPGYGFFGSSPYMWLGLLAIPLGVFFVAGPRRWRWRIRWMMLSWLVAMLALWLVNAGAIEWRAGWTIGPRYLGAAPPFFAFGALFGLERLAQRGHVTRSIARGMAGGLALASVLSIGLVGIMYDTLPDTIARPLVQFALPLSRAGFVPHHVLEWFGVQATWPWYVAAACMMLAPIWAALVPIRDVWYAYIGRVVAAGLALYVGMMPALSTPPPEEQIEPDIRGFVSIWEPIGRDRLSLAKLEADRLGPRSPCAWMKLGYIERILGFKWEADRDEKKALVGKDHCKKIWF